MNRIRHIVKRIREGRLTELFAELTWLSVYAKRYWWLIALYTFLMTSGSLLSIGSTVVSKDLVDAVTGHNAADIAYVITLYVGTAMIARIARIAITAISSTNVNPFFITSPQFFYSLFWIFIVI